MYACEYKRHLFNDTLLTAVSCGSPPSIDNGFPGTPTSTTFGGVVTYSCEAGFVLFRKTTVECLVSANWSPLPFCSGKRKVFIQMSGPQL